MLMDDVEQRGHFGVVDETTARVAIDARRI
jgi:hypothetical protein